jgi:tetratricopeptide (TPR) repeat protein
MQQDNRDGSRGYQTHVEGNAYIGNNYFSSDQKNATPKKILLLSAHPQASEAPYRKQEVKEIRKAIKRAKHGNLIEIEDRREIEATDFSQELSTIEPYVIDIFGADTGIERLVLETPARHSQRGNEELIADFFRLYSKSVECVIFNRCYLESQAREIVKHVKFVIGINCNLENAMAIEFLNEFYYQLGSSRTIKDSYDFGRNRLESKGFKDLHLLPVLLDRDYEKWRKGLENKLKSCNTQIQLNENSPELWKEKAELLRDLGHPTEADQAYEKASSLDPRNYKIRTEQGDASEKLGNYEKAVNAYNKALELEEQDYTVWWKKGKALSNAKRYSDAQKPYEYALMLEPPPPDNYVIYREYGSVLYSLGKYSESVRLYKKSLGIEPKYRASNYEKRQVYKTIYFGSRSIYH